MKEDMNEEQRKLLADVIAQPENDAPRLAYAEWLELSGNEITAFGAKELAESPHFPCLTELCLEDNNIGKAIMDTIVTPRMEERRRAQGGEQARGC